MGLDIKDVNDVLNGDLSDYAKELLQYEVVKVSQSKITVSNVLKPLSCSLQWYPKA